MATSVNRRAIVMGERTWDKLGKLAKDEEGSRSGLIREAVHDLLLKRERLEGKIYDPVSDSFVRGKISK